MTFWTAADTDPRDLVDAPPPVATRSRLTSRAWKILLGGLLVREAFSFWTGHQFDFESWVRTGYAVSLGQNPYPGFLPPAPGTSFDDLNQTLTGAAYLPFWPLLLGGLYRVWDVVGGGNRFVLYFLLKQPGILADVASAYFLYRIVNRWLGDLRAAFAVLSFWSFFPYAIAITAIWGQFDSIVVLILLMLLYAHGGIERSVLYGLGIFVKWLAAIFLPLEVFRDRGIRRLLALIGFALPALLTVLVFAAEGWSLPGIGSVSYYQSHGDGAGLNWAWVFSIPSVSAWLSPIPHLYDAAGYLWVPGVIAAGWMASKWLRMAEPRSELRALLLVLTVFLLLRWGLYEQYFLYLFSLLALDVVVFHPGRRALLWFTIVLASVGLLVNNDLGLEFLSPVYPGFNTYTMAIDASYAWGGFRIYGMAVIALVMTATLVQFVLTLLRDQESPRPWLYLAGDRLRDLVFSGNGP
ncbi:MAG: glycosyltransferase 87 family protein [Thermoplasmata archaeon]|jgi:hypothetical protein